MRIVVVTGTDTSVGGTVVTAGPAPRGERITVVKAVQAGVSPGEPGDLGEIRRLAGTINAVIVDDYPTTLGRSPQDALDLLAGLNMPVKELSNPL
ncbi:MAG: hypothetical protein ACR2L9_12150 [Solirubrobacteraceae bacterium]